MSKVALDFLNYYRSEIGDRKFRKIVEEVNTAKRFNQLIKISAKHRVLPGTKDFFECILNSLEYSFAGKQKLIAMALLLMDRWNKEVNSKYGISSDDEVSKKAQRIINDGGQLGI